MRKIACLRLLSGMPALPKQRHLGTIMRCALVSVIDHSTCMRTAKRHCGALCPATLQQRQQRQRLIIASPLSGVPRLHLHQCSSARQGHPICMRALHSRRSTIDQHALQACACGCAQGEPGTCRCAFRQLHVGTDATRRSLGAQRQGDRAPARWRCSDAHRRTAAQPRARQRTREKQLIAGAIVADQHPAQQQGDGHLRRYAEQRHAAGDAADFPGRPTAARVHLITMRVDEQQIFLMRSSRSSCCA